MKDYKFKREVEIILYDVSQYGLKNCGFACSKKNLKKENNMKKFIELVHIGFMRGQKNIIHNIKQLLLERKKLNKRLKTLKKEKKDNEIEKIQCLINKNKYQEIVFRKLADTILWQIVKEDDTVLKRLYHGKPFVDITNSNLESDEQFIKDSFNSNHLIFPLLSDITSIVQVGDVIVYDFIKNKIEIVELKEGKVNEAIKDIFDKVSKTKCDRHLYFELENKDDKFMKQFNRYAKQVVKRKNTIDTINNNEGIDYCSGLKVKIPEKVYFIELFDQDILHMLKEASDKGWSINIIEECLYIGIYTNKSHENSLAFNAWIKGLGIDFGIANYRESFHIPLAYPLFNNIFNNNDKIKIVMGDIQIKMTLDINKWLELVEKKGLKYRWLSKKETGRVDSSLSGMSPFTYRERGLEINQSILYGGVFARMFYRFVKPSSAIGLLGISTE